MGLSFETAQVAQVGRENFESTTEHCGAMTPKPYFSQQQRDQVAPGQSVHLAGGGGPSLGEFSCMEKRKVVR